MQANRGVKWNDNGLIIDKRFIKLFNSISFLIFFPLLLVIYYSTYTKINPKDYSIVHAICNRYQIPLLDYVNDNRFFWRYELFFDGSLLNEKSAKIYSSIVASDVNKLMK